MIPISLKLVRIATILRMAVDADFGKAYKILEYIDGMFNDEKNFTPTKEKPLTLSSTGITKLKGVKKYWPEIDREINSFNEEKPHLDYFIPQLFANFIAAYQLKYRLSKTPITLHPTEFKNKPQGIKESRAELNEVLKDFKKLEKAPIPQPEFV